MTVLYYRFVKGDEQHVFSTLAAIRTVLSSDKSIIQCLTMPVSHCVNPYSPSSYKPCTFELVFSVYLCRLVNLVDDAKLKLIAHELLQSVRSNATVDWQQSEMARAKIRVAVKRILKKYGYHPDLETEAIKVVLQQAEASSQKWAA